MAPANAALALGLAAFLAWRWKARGAGEGFFTPVASAGASAVLLPLSAFVLLSILSACFSTWPARSLSELKGLWTFALLPVALALFRREEDADLLLDGWKLTVAWLAIEGILEMARGAGGVDERIRGGMSSYMTFAGLMAPLAILLIARGASRIRSWRRRVSDLGLGLLAATMVGLSLTRSAFLGLGAGLLAVLVALRPKALFVAMPALAALLLGPPQVRARTVSIFDTSDASALDRRLMWRAGVEMIQDRPLFGVGPGRVKEVYPVYRQPGFVDPRAGHLHDNLVMVAAETGLPSAAAYAWLVGALAASAWRRARPAGGGWRTAAGALGAVVALAVAGVFEYNFGDVEVLRLLLAVAALPFALSRPAPPGP